MESIKLKSYLAIILIVLLLSSCTKGEDKMKIIAYGTPEFEEFVKKAPINLEKAWDLQLKYYEENEEKVIGSPLFFIINDKYIFTPYYNPKIPEVKLSGVSIDSQTGEATYVNMKDKLKPKSQFGWRKSKN
ncbi:hypothetical protein AMRN_2708 [Malaciobacter marinus]|uniref:Lipoprotein n=2 Tax=Malaciobacter marinus TaxID=505249 RepID=A0A347TP78_9BACT|nr:hypothetical protein AMRN_2708 [Malaciobacter marinus]PHO13439.1 hypothetical protein CPG38_03005 [Malaciobacter marinus]PHO16671.1 hypothetical protein CPH92_00625 [Malaciobacter marinus]RYA24659.1 hypothetical protein CRU96_02025 [Malaciobacter halophilus]